MSAQERKNVGPSRTPGTEKENAALLMRTVRLRLLTLKETFEMVGLLEEMQLHIYDIDDRTLQNKPATDAQLATIYQLAYKVSEHMMDVKTAIGDEIVERRK